MDGGHGSRNPLKSV